MLVIKICKIYNSQAPPLPPERYRLNVSANGLPKRDAIVYFGLLGAPGFIKTTGDSFNGS
jgi:hypothetical protein